MCDNKVLLNPCNEVAFKNPIDQLVETLESIRRQDFVDLRLQEIIYEWQLMM